MAMPPCPYATPNDDDLTGVITHLRPSNTRKGTQPRDPNEPETRWLLEAGLRTLTALLLDTPAPEGSVAYLSANGLFSTMSLDSVMQTFRRMCTEQGIDPGGANKARILRRWDYTANYQLDLIAYLFRTSVNAHRVAQVHSAVAAALPSLTFGDLVTSLLTSESATPADAQLVRVQLVIRLMFADDPAVRALASEQFTSDVDLWTPIYEHALHAYGLQGTLQHATVRDVAAMLAFIVEATFVGRAAATDTGDLTDGRPLSLAVATAALSHHLGRPWNELAALPYVGATP